MYTALNYVIIDSSSAMFDAKPLLSWTMLTGLLGNEPLSSLKYELKHILLSMKYIWKRLPQNFDYFGRWRIS